MRYEDMPGSIEHLSVRLALGRGRWYSEQSLEVKKCHAKGATVEQIAVALGVKPRTVERWIAHANEQLETRRIVRQFNRREARKAAAVK